MAPPADFTSTSTSTTSKTAIYSSALPSTTSTLTSKPPKRLAATPSSSTASTLRHEALLPPTSASMAPLYPSDHSSAHIPWSTLPLPTLHAYRTFYSLPVPRAFTSAHHERLLTSRSTLGLQSPTMAAARTSPRLSGSETNGWGELKPRGEMGERSGRGRVSKEALARAVRRDFNSRGVSEMEVVSRFLYVGKRGDRRFRMRFGGTTRPPGR